MDLAFGTLSLHPSRSPGPPSGRSSLDQAAEGDLRLEDADFADFVLGDEEYEKEEGYLDEGEDDFEIGRVEGYDVPEGYPVGPPMKEYHADEVIPTWENEGDYVEGEARCASAVRDLYSSERAYVKAVRRTNGGFARPLREYVAQQNARNKGRWKQKAPPEVVEEEIMVIFGPIDDILGVHERFLRALDERDKESEPTEGMAEVFGILVPAFKYYRRYARNHPRALGTLDWLSRRSTGFAKHLASLSEERGGSEPWNILASLLQPIERFPYYTAFLNTLARWTPPGHADTETLETLAQTFDEGLAGVLQVMYESEAHLQVLDVQANLHGLPEPLATVRRRLLYQGRASRIHAITKDKEPVLLLLFDDCLLWVKESASKGLSFRGRMMLRKPTVTAISPNEGYGWCLAIQCDNRIELWALASEGEREVWLEVLEDTLVKSCLRAASDVKRALSHAQEIAVMLDMDRIL